MTETEQWQSALFALLPVSCDRSPMAGFCYESNIHARTLKQLSKNSNIFIPTSSPVPAVPLLIIPFQSSANVLYFWIQSQCNTEMLNVLSTKLSFVLVFFTFMAHHLKSAPSDLRYLVCFFLVWRQSCRKNKWQREGVWTRTTDGFGYSLWLP